MTMRTSYKLTCSCGHHGLIKMSENDQPYSKSWERYSLDGFNGSEFGVDGSAEWDKVFIAMKPTCPKCGIKLSPENLETK